MVPPTMGFTQVCVSVVIRPHTDLVRYGKVVRLVVTKTHWPATFRPFYLVAPSHGLMGAVRPVAWVGTGGFDKS